MLDRMPSVVAAEGKPCAHIHIDHKASAASSPAVDSILVLKDEDLSPEETMGEIVAVASHTCDAQVLPIDFWTHLGHTDLSFACRCTMSHRPILDHCHRHHRDRVS